MSCFNTSIYISTTFHRCINHMISFYIFFIILVNRLIYFDLCSMFFFYSLHIFLRYNISFVVVMFSVDEQIERSSTVGKDVLGQEIHNDSSFFLSFVLLWLYSLTLLFLFSSVFSYACLDFIYMYIYMDPFPFEEQLFFWIKIKQTKSVATRTSK